MLAVVVTIAICCCLLNNKNRRPEDEEELLHGDHSWCDCLDQMLCDAEPLSVFLKKERRMVLQHLHNPILFASILEQGCVLQTSAFKELRKRHSTMTTRLSVDGSQLVISLCLLFFERETLKLASKWVKANSPSTGFPNIQRVILGGLRCGIATMVGGLPADHVQPGTGDEKVELYKAKQALPEFQKNVKSIVAKMKEFDLGTEVFDLYKKAKADQLTSFHDFVTANYPTNLQIKECLQATVEASLSRTSSESQPPLLLPATCTQIQGRRSRSTITLLE